jgi:hypothetical protein
MNDTTTLRRAFLSLMSVGEWTPKMMIKDIGREVKEALEEWRHLDTSLYLDAKALEVTQINRLHDLVGMADRLKLNLYKFILYLEEQNK